MLENSQQLYCMQAHGAKPNPSFLGEQDQAELSFLGALDGAAQAANEKGHKPASESHTGLWALHGH